MGTVQPPVAVINLEFPLKSLICDFAHCSPGNGDTFYLNLVVIPSSPKRKITKDRLCNYYENYEEDKDKWEVDSNGEVVPFFYAIAD